MTGSGTERLGVATRGRPAARGRILAVVVVAAGAGEGGQTPDLHLSHRDDHGLAEGDIPDHLALREDALGHLATVDLTDTPYGETLHRDLCAQLKPGCHARIDPLRIPGPPARP